MAKRSILLLALTWNFTIWAQSDQAGFYDLYQARALFPSSSLIEDLPINSELAVSFGERIKTRCTEPRKYELNEKKRNTIADDTAYGDRRGITVFKDLNDVSFECQACLDKVVDEPVELKRFSTTERPKFDAGGDLIFKGKTSGGSNIIYRCIKFKGGKDFWSVWNAFKDGGLIVQIGKMKEAGLKAPTHKGDSPKTEM